MPGLVSFSTWGEVSAASPIAAFDLDGTLVKHKTARARKVRPDGPDDWEWLPAAAFRDPSSRDAPPTHTVADTLRALHKRGYLIAVITNQSPRSKKTAAESAAIAGAILKSVAESVPDVPILLLGATLYDEYRKPMTGLWREALRRAGRTAETRVNGRDFYCGDAAGRPGDFKSNGRPARSDLAFAANAGIQFATPEYIFAGARHREPPPLTRPPRRIGARSLEILAAQLIDAAGAREARLFIPVGLPGCGKSTLGAEMAKRGAIHVSKDVEKSGYLGKVELQLGRGHRVVADCTNLKIEERDHLRGLAAEQETNFIFIDMLEYVEEADGPRIGDGCAWHWNCCRGEAGGAFVPKIAFSRMKKTAVAVGSGDGERDALIVLAPPLIPSDDHRFFDNVPA